MPKEIEKQIPKIVEEKRSEIIEFLRDLIRIPSVTGEEKQIQEFISKKLREIGLEVDQWEPDPEKIRQHPAYFPTFGPAQLTYKNRPNVIGKYRGEGGKSLLFNGHVDVIPVEPRSAWKHDPWEGEIEDKKLYGRGASDMKGGLAAMTMALDCLLDADIEPKGNIFLEYVVDEELSGFGTLSCVLKGYKADAGISCEASDLEIQPAATGSMWFEIKVKGKPASMSRLWEGVSALDKGYKIAQAVSELQTLRFSEKSHPLYPDPKGALACFVGKFDAGTYPSSLPTLCSVKGRMGVLPNEEPKVAQEELIEYIKKAAIKDEWLKENLPQTKLTGYYAEPAEIPSGHPICKVLADSFERIKHKKPLLKGHEGATDARFLIGWGKTPTVIFGPGTIAQMHAQDEWIRIDDLLDSVKILALTIVNWCGSEPPLPTS
jgi:acetylornithine deacetylase